MIIWCFGATLLRGTFARTKTALFAHMEMQSFANLCAGVFFCVIMTYFKSELLVPWMWSSRLTTLSFVLVQLIWPRCVCTDDLWCVHACVPCPAARETCNQLSRPCFPLLRRVRSWQARRGSLCAAFGRVKAKCGLDNVRHSNGASTPNHEATDVHPYIFSYYITLYYIISYHIILWYVILYYIIFILYYIIPYHIISYYAYIRYIYTRTYCVCIYIYIHMFDASSLLKARGSQFVKRVGRLAKVTCRRFSWSTTSYVRDSFKTGKFSSIRTWQGSLVNSY